MLQACSPGFSSCYYTRWQVGPEPLLLDCVIQILKCFWFFCFLQAKLTPEEALRHFIFVQEYYWRIADPSPLPGGMAIRVIDLKGLRLADLGSDAFSLVKKVSFLVRTACASVIQAVEGIGDLG